MKTPWNLLLYAVERIRFLGAWKQHQAFWEHYEKLHAEHERELFEDRSEYAPPVYYSVEGEWKFPESGRGYMTVEEYRRSILGGDK